MSMRRLTLGCLAALLLAGAAAAEEPGRIEGRLVHAETGRALAGVTVVVAETGDAQVTDARGAFLFAPLPPGTYTLSLTLGRHATNLPEVAVGAGETVPIEEELDWVLEFGEEITVFAASRRAERITEAPASVTVFTEEEIARAAAHGQGPKIIEHAPGVDFTQSGLYDFNFSIRGFNSSLNRRILTLIDGRDPSVPFLGVNEWAAVSYPLDEMATIELVRGPGAALYGANAFNGVLNLLTKQPRFAQGGNVRVTGGDLDTRRIDARHAGTLADGWHFRVTGGAQTSEDFTRSRVEAVEYTEPCATQGQRDCLPLEAVGLALDEVELAYGSARLDLDRDGPVVMSLEGGWASVEGPTFQTGIGRVQVTDVERPWGRFNLAGPDWNFLAYYDARRARDQIALQSGAALFEDSYNWRAELQRNLDFAQGRGRVVFGYSVHRQDVDTADRDGVQTLMANRVSAEHHGFFGQIDYQLSARLKAVLASRFDLSTLHDDQFSPKASLVYSLGPGHALRLTFNEAFQVPNYSELFLTAPAAAPLDLSALEAALEAALGIPLDLGFGFVPVLARGNDALAVEEIRSYELGYTGIVGDRVHITFDAYRNEARDFVTDLLPGVNPAFPAYQPLAALPEPARQAILSALAGALGDLVAGMTTVDGLPSIVFSYTNAGRVDTRGIEAAIRVHIDDDWLVDFNLARFDFDVRDEITGDRILPNAPKNKLNLGIEYRQERWDARIDYRWVDDYDWSVGIFDGFVPSFEVVNLRANARLSDRWRVGLNVSNLLDSDHWEAFGGDRLGRRALAHVNVSW